MSNDYPIKDKITYKNHIGCDLGTQDGKCIRFSDNGKHKPFITNIYKERLDKAIEYIENLQQSNEELQRDYNKTIDFGIYETDDLLSILRGEE